MVLLSAAICRKNGNTILSRQFVEMTRSRIEGLLAAFPKLMNTGKQHTFVETESVRYVYQPLEKMYMLLITTKNSNILEDLETLRLFSRVIPEYCQKIDEQSVQDNAYELIFAFDEVVALGYRESVNLAQIRTFTEMDSHDEKLHKAVRETQEKEAKQQMRQKAKELQQAKLRMNQSHGRSLTSNSMGFGSSMKSSSAADIITAQAIPEPVSKPAPKRTTKNAMKLGGGKSKDVDKFVDNLRQEGQQIRSVKTTKKEVVQAAVATNQVKQESAHVKINEKLQIEATRNGDYDVRVLGELALHINNEECNKIRVLCNVDCEDKNFKFQTHPNVMKYNGANHVIAMKNQDRTFPLNQDVNVLKWKLQSDDETHVPLQINCWPDEDGSGNCDVNIEYELIMTSHELNDVTISIPVPSGVGAPQVTDCQEGEYKHDSRKNLLVWTIPVIDESNSSGILNFSIPSNPDDFYPVNIQFTCTKQSYTSIEIKEVQQVDTKDSVKFSLDRIMYADKFEVA